jgi:hypothetical protein
MIDHQKSKKTSGIEKKQMTEITKTPLIVEMVDNIHELSLNNLDDLFARQSNANHCQFC